MTTTERYDLTAERVRDVLAKRGAAFTTGGHGACISGCCAMEARAIALGKDPGSCDAGFATVRGKFTTKINDSPWSSPSARTNAMMEMVLLRDPDPGWCRRLVLAIVRKLSPGIMRSIDSMQHFAECFEELESIEKCIELLDSAHSRMELAAAEPGIPGTEEQKNRFAAARVIDYMGGACRIVERTSGDTPAAAGRIGDAVMWLADLNLNGWLRVDPIAGPNVVLKRAIRLAVDCWFAPDGTPEPGGIGSEN